MALRASNAVAFSALEVTKGICLLYSFWIFLVSFLTSELTDIDKSKSFCSPVPEAGSDQIMITFILQSIIVKHYFAGINQTKIRNNKV